MPHAWRLRDRGRQAHQRLSPDGPLRRPHRRPRLAGWHAWRAGTAGFLLPAFARSGSGARRRLHRFPLHQHRRLWLSRRSGCAHRREYSQNGAAGKAGDTGSRVLLLLRGRSCHLRKTAGLRRMSSEEHDKMRIDKWLWAARFFKTRSLAADAVEGGKVTMNEARIKVAKAIGVGDRLDIRLGQYHFDI